MGAQSSVGKRTGGEVLLGDRFIQIRQDIEHILCIRGNSGENHVRITQNSSFGLGNVHNEINACTEVK